MPIAVEEILYPALEDYKLDLVIGQGPAARTVKIDLEPFTLVGATTRIGLLSSPLRDRFGIISRLEFYTPEELSRVVIRSSRILGVPITEGGALEIGRRSRGTPRIANRLLRRVRDFAAVYGSGVVDEEQASHALRRMDVDENGLDQMDRKLLRVLVDIYGGGPVGVKTLAVACSEEVRTIEDIYEPYLIQCGFLKRTSRGRMATAKAYKHLNMLGVQPRVELLAHTPEPLSLVYAAFRQCYHAGFVADMWPRLLAGDIGREKQAQFVASIMESGHASPVEHVSFTFALGGASARAPPYRLIFAAEPALCGRFRFRLSDPAGDPEKSGSAGAV